MVDRCKNFQRYKGIFQPRCNCKACWLYYFMQHEAKCNAIDHIRNTRGDKVAAMVVGDKYFKMFKLYRLGKL